MFNLSGTEIIVILLLALVILGPEKLPEAMRKAGRAYSELRKMANSFQSEVRSVLDEPMEELRGTADALRDATNFTGSSKKPNTSPASKPAKPAVEPAVEAEPEDAAIDDLLDNEDHDADAVAAGGPEPEPEPESTASEDLITRTLSGDVAPHEPTDEADPPGPAA